MNPDHFDKEDLIKCGHGELFPGSMRLPINEMLMFDRVTHIADDDGLYGKGSLVAGARHQSGPVVLQGALR